jgi:fructose-bisphosphate aldolase class II
MTERSAALDAELIGRLREVVGVPLVLHGSSGVPDAELAQAVAAGITKVNVGTLLSVAYTSAVREALAAAPEVTDPRKYLRPARDKIAAVVADLLRVIHPDQP